jgi:hypothetical protein
VNGSDTGKSEMLFLLSVIHTCFNNKTSFFNLRRLHAATENYKKSDEEYGKFSVKALHFGENQAFLSNRSPLS